MLQLVCSIGHKNTRTLLYMVDDTSVKRQQDNKVRLYVSCSHSNAVVIKHFLIVYLKVPKRFNFK